MAQPISGLGGLAGITAISETEAEAFATPEERSGGVADPFHGHVGQQAEPYPWQSQAMPGGSHGPYGPQNQMLGDEFWFLEPAGDPTQDPDFDYVTPSLTRSHGAPHNVGNSGAAPSQYEAINNQLGQMANHFSDKNTDASMINNTLGDVQNDHWVEIWEVDPGNSDLPPVGKQYSVQANGFGVNDAASNAYRKQNLFGWGSKHMHRRYAAGHMPGNYMWMRPGGRPLFKTTAGTARLPIGQGSQFEGQDPGAAFDYAPGAILQTIPDQYVPPPSPYIGDSTPMYDDPNGTDAIALW